MISELKLKKVMSSILGVKPSDITENSSQDNISDWDSLKHMNLLIALEEEFQITIPDEDAANITSYKLIHFVVNDLTKSK